MTHLSVFLFVSSHARLNSYFRVISLRIILQHLNYVSHQVKGTKDVPGEDGNAAEDVNSICRSHPM